MDVPIPKGENDLTVIAVARLKTIIPKQRKFKFKAVTKETNL